MRTIYIVFNDKFSYKERKTVLNYKFILPVPFTIITYTFANIGVLSVCIPRVLEIWINHNNSPRL